MATFTKTFTKAFSDDYVQPPSYTSGYLEPYSDRDHEMAEQFPGIRVKAPYVTTKKEHMPQDLNFED